MTGRKSKLTPQLQQKIVDVIAAGNYHHVAARYAGIDQATFYRYMSLGEQAQSGIYFEFCKAVKEAEAQAQARNVAIIQRAANDSWQAAAWWLERKYYQDWGRKERIEHSGNAAEPVRHEHSQPVSAQELAEAALILEDLRISRNGHDHQPATG